MDRGRLLLFHSRSSNCELELSGREPRRNERMDVSKHHRATTRTGVAGKERARRKRIEDRGGAKFSICPRKRTREMKKNQRDATEVRWLGSSLHYQRCGCGTVHRKRAGTVLFKPHPLATSLCSRVRRAKMVVIGRAVSKFVAVAVRPCPMASFPLSLWHKQRAERTQISPSSKSR